MYYRVYWTILDGDDATSDHQYVIIEADSQSSAMDKFLKCGKRNHSTMTEDEFLYTSKPWFDDNGPESMLIVEIQNPTEVDLFEYLQSGA